MSLRGLPLTRPDGNPIPIHDSTFLLKHMATALVRIGTRGFSFHLALS